MGIKSYSSGNIFGDEHMGHLLARLEATELNSSSLVNFCPKCDSALTQCFTKKRSY